MLILEFLGDIRDYDSVFKSMKGCDTVFHLAALIGIPYSYNSPLAYLKTNVEGTYNVLESGKNQGIDQLVITSTSEVYGSAQFTPINEKHPLVGQSPYSASKIAADQLALSYHKSFKMPVKILRPFNTYGPRQSLRAVIPTIISQCLKEKSLYVPRAMYYTDVNTQYSQASPQTEGLKGNWKPLCVDLTNGNKDENGQDLIVGGGTPIERGANLTFKYRRTPKAAVANVSLGENPAMDVEYHVVRDGVCIIKKLPIGTSVIVSA